VIIALAQSTGGIDGALIAGFVLFGIAIVVALLEFIVPSAGALAVLCGLCILAGVVSFFIHSALWGFAALAFALGGAPFAIGWGLRVWTSTPLARRAIHSTQLHAAERGQSPKPGAEGLAITDLRPSGRVRIDGTIHEAITDGEFVESGTPIRVVEGGSVGGLRVTALRRS
jgi:membrane-bound serine protease (ClpP class)